MRQPKRCTGGVAPAFVDVDTRTGAVSVTRVDVARVLQSLLFTQSNRLQFALRFSAVWVPIGATLGAISGVNADSTPVVYVAADSTPQAGSQMQPMRRVTSIGARPMCRRKPGNARHQCASTAGSSH